MGTEQQQLEEEEIHIAILSFTRDDVKPMCTLCNALCASCKMNFIWLTRNEKMYKKCTEQKNYSKHNCKKTDSVWEHSLFGLFIYVGLICSNV